MATHLDYREKLGYLSIDKLVSVGNNTFMMGDLYYIPLCCFVTDYQFTPPDSEPSEANEDM